MVLALEERLEVVENQQRDTRRLTRIEQRDRDIYMTTVELYSRLIYVLQEHWFPTLPRSVKKRLMTGPSTNLPRALACWWVLWNHIDPTSYALPQGLLLNEPLSVSDDPDWSDQLITSHGYEMALGVAVRRAWEHITPVDRELMLFCWAARQNDRQDRNRLAHLKPT